MPATLIRHPGSKGPDVGICVHHERQGDRLWVRFVVEGDVAAIRWPATKPGGREDFLWQHTCFEVFVTTSDGYREFNLSPSRQWASYRFSSYRADMVDAPEGVKGLALDLASDMLALEAHLELPLDARTMALSTVIEAHDGSKSYWALTHPGETPDFHHPASFTLDLTEPS